MSQINHTFVGRTQELEQWSRLLAEPAGRGQAVVVIGKYGMGKTWLLEKMIQTAQEHKTLKCFTARYIMGPGESPGMILRIILDDMFQAARYMAGTLNATGKRFEQWIPIYQKLGIFLNQSVTDFRILERLRFDSRKNIFDQFTTRLKLLSDMMPEHGRLLLAIDPELDTMASRVELWTQVVKDIPPKVIFLFAQRYKDSLAINEEFQSQNNVHFIPSPEQQPQGLADLQENEIRQLLNIYMPKFAGKSVEEQALLERFHLYRNHPYAVHAALNLLLSPSVASVEQLPADQTPGTVCPIQWKGIIEHPLREDAIRLFQTFAVLEIPTLDEMVCWVADMPPKKLKAILDDPFLGSMIRKEPDGRLLYHHYLMDYIRSLLYIEDGELTPEAMQLHQRAMTGYADMTHRLIKPDPQATVRLAEHALAVGGPTLFAKTLYQCSELYFALGFYQTYAMLIDRALGLLPPESSESADLFFQLGQLRRLQKNHQIALQHYKAALRMAKKISTPDRVGAILFCLGRVSFETEHILEAETWLKDAIAHYEVSSDKSGMAEVLVLAAEVQWTQGRIKEAEVSLKTALNTVGEIRNYRQQAKSMSAIYAAWGRMYDQMGNIERSTEQYHKALDLTKDTYDQQTEAEQRASLSSMFERVGNLKLAEEHASKAMTIHYDLRLLERWAEDNLRLARIAEMQGKPKEREYHIEQARQMYQQLGNKQKLDELGAVT